MKDRLKKAFKNGATGPLTTREVQELLNVHKIPAGIDGRWGGETRMGLKAFRVAKFGAATGWPDEVKPATRTHDALLAPFLAPFMGLTFSVLLGASFCGLVRRIARAFLQPGGVTPQEIGGNNRGPWVRLFADGAQGDSVKWCAHFATCTVVDMAEEAWLGAGRSLSYPGDLFSTPSCGEILRQAKAKAPHLLVDAPVEGGLFLVLRPNPVHVGIVDCREGDWISTIEGNAEGDKDGKTDLPDSVCVKLRNWKREKLQFIDLR